MTSLSGPWEEEIPFIIPHKHDLAVWAIMFHRIILFSAWLFWNNGSSFHHTGKASHLCFTSTDPLFMPRPLQKNIRYDQSPEWSLKDFTPTQLALFQHNLSYQFLYPPAIRLLILPFSGLPALVLHSSEPSILLQSRQISSTVFPWLKKKYPVAQKYPTNLQHPNDLSILFFHLSPHLLIILPFRVALLLSIPLTPLPNTFPLPAHTLFVTTCVSSCLFVTLPLNALFLWRSLSAFFMPKALFSLRERLPDVPELSCTEFWILLPPLRQWLPFPIHSLSAGILTLPPYFASHKELIQNYHFTWARRRSY